MKRMLIYFFWDKDGIVDDYIPYCLNNFAPFFEKILVVVNGNITEQSIEKLKPISAEILIRENTELDVGAYKYAFETYGWDKLSEYDEVVVTNFTLFGPFYSLEQMFSKMDKKKCDFWGLTNYPIMQNGKVIEEHVQSYFVSYRKSLLMSVEFKHYWTSLPTIKSYEDSVKHHELKQTIYFNQKGFSFDSYINLEEYPFPPSGNPIISRAESILIDKKCPLIKRRVFYYENGCFQHGLNLEKIKYITNYIKYLTSYDIDFIYKNILRTNGKRVTNKIKLLQWSIKSKLSLSKQKRQHYHQKIKSNIDYLRYLRKDSLYYDNLKLLSPSIPYVGKHTYAAPDLSIANQFSTIGSFCSIGLRCVLGHGKHPINFLSSSPFFYYDELSFKLKEKNAHSEFWFLEPINIGNDVWIGDGVFVKNGINIGNGAIVGAMSVVTKDVPPYSIVVGNPAKVIRYRFDEQTIDKLQKLRWWDLDDETIKQIPYDDIDSTLSFLEAQHN